VIAAFSRRAEAERGPCRVSAALLVLTCATGGARCGYRPIARGLPLGLPRIHVAAPEVFAVDEPLLGELLRTELGRELARRGARLPPTPAGAPTLHTRVLALATKRVALTAGALAAAELELRFEVRLADARDTTLWRSGLIEVEAHCPLARETLASEEARRVALARLARRAATLAVERLADRED
jgi:hypothetical protein